MVLVVIIIIIIIHFFAEKVAYFQLRILEIEDCFDWQVKSVLLCHHTQYL